MEMNTCMNTCMYIFAVLINICSSDTNVSNQFTRTRHTLTSALALLNFFGLFFDQSVTYASETDAVWNLCVETGTVDLFGITLITFRELADCAILSSDFSAGFNLIRADDGRVKELDDETFRDVEVKDKITKSYEERLNRRRRVVENFGVDLSVADTYWNSEYLYSNRIFEFMPGCVRRPCLRNEPHATVKSVHEYCKQEFFMFSVLSNVFSSASSDFYLVPDVLNVIKSTCISMLCDMFQLDHHLGNGLFFNIGIRCNVQPHVLADGFNLPYDLPVDDGFKYIDKARHGWDIDQLVEYAAGDERHSRLMPFINERTYSL